MAKQNNEMEENGLGAAHGYVDTNEGIGVSDNPPYEDVDG